VHVRIAVTRRRAAGAFITGIARRRGKMRHAAMRRRQCRALQYAYFHFPVMRAAKWHHECNIYMP